MKAMVLHGERLSVEEVDQPAPGPDQVLARVLACGICGTDLHTLKAAQAGVRRMDGLVMGHELVAELVEAAAGLPAGTRVVCSPSIPRADVVAALPPAEVPGTPPVINLFLHGRSRTIGVIPELSGGYGEYVVLSAPLLVPVPAHVSNRVAVTAEPCAVGLHAVRAARVRPDERVLVLGAGPIGLMTLLWLKREGVAHVAVSEPAAPRRQLAERLGADLVIDPAAEAPAARLSTATGGLPPVVFDCVGAPGSLQQALDAVATEGRVIVVGVCSTEDTLRPAAGIVKHLALQFVLGYTAAEVGEALAAIADGSIDTAPLVTRAVSLDELPAAMHSLNDPQDCKVIVQFA